jgi:hypothetical protein
MDTNALKKFALDTRKQIEAAIQYRAKEIQQKDDYLTLEKPKETQALRNLINAHQLQETVEKYAYTWFNRFIAITYLELHNLSPLQTLVIGPDPNNPNAIKPKILKELLNGFTPDFLILYDAPPSRLPKGVYSLEYLQNFLPKKPVLISETQKISPIEPFLSTPATPCTIISLAGIFWFTLSSFFLRCTKKKGIV